jgi:hypothetical protein
MATYYWVGGDGTWDASSTANWSLTSGGLPGVAAPSSADTVIFDSASGTGTCTTAAGATCTTATLNSSTLNLTLGANLTQLGSFTLTLGALNLNSNSLTCTVFSSSNSNVRSIDFGTGNITLTDSNRLVWSTSTANNFTYTGTPTVISNYSGSTGTRTFNHGGGGGATEANTPSFYITAGTDSVSIASLSKTLDFTGFNGTLNNIAIFVYGNLVISSGMTLAAGANSISFRATSGTQQITTNGKTLDFPITQNGVGGTVQLQDNLTMGSTRTFTLTSGTLDLSSGNRTLSTGLFSSNNSNTRSIAFGTGKITVTGNAATVWQMATQTGFAPTGSKLVEFTYAGGTGTRSIAHGSTSTGNSTTALNFSVTAGTDIVDMVNTGSLYVINLNFTGFSGTLNDIRYTIYGNLIFTSGMTLTSQTTATSFAGTGTTQNITTAGKTLDFPLTFDGVGSTFVFQDALTQGSTQAFTVTNGTVQLKNGVTSTVGAFATSGTNQKFLQSTTPSSTATLSQASGTVDASYLTIRDITAIGGATFNAFTDQSNVDAGNVEGWDFGISPIVGGAEYTYALRSLTEQRRF